MKKIKIQKFCDDQLIDSSELPILLVNLASKFLPDIALTELEEKGILINKMVELANANESFMSTVEIIENAKKIRVAFSLIK